jgi:hypothetical protein
MKMAPQCPYAPVSWGELLDKITILEIKRDRIASAPARANVVRELALLQRVAGEVTQRSALRVLIERLRAINEALWDIEDSIREHEAAGTFGENFVNLARSVYTQNDRRAALKRQINELLLSQLVEEKSYASPASIEKAAAQTVPLTSRL